MCNSKELLKLLQTIKPDAIFEELSQQSFTDIYDGRLSDTLETNAIKIYSNEKTLKQFSVDGNQLVDKKLKDSISNMFEIFDRNIDYQCLILQLQNLVYEFGLPYLNSIQCEALFAQKYFLEQRLAEQENIVAIHQIWIKINDIRERQMLKNIYKHLELNAFNSVIFLVGAEHRKPIIDLINRKEIEGKVSVKWIFDIFLL
jgi:hypothetical protein